jgi:lipid-A-disaccharide synthase
MEIERHLAAFAAASTRIRKARPTVRPVLALTQSAPAEEIAARAGRIAGAGIPVISGRTREAVAAATLAISVSGTATLETALLGCPMLVCYRAGWINYLLGRLLVTVPCISLANVISGHPTVPELYQTEVCPETISSAALAILEDAPGRERMRKALAGTREKLGVHGASRRAAESVASELQKSS